MDKEIGVIPIFDVIVREDKVTAKDSFGGIHRINIESTEKYQHENGRLAHVDSINEWDDDRSQCFEIVIGYEANTKQKAKLLEDGTIMLF